MTDVKFPCGTYTNLLHYENSVGNMICGLMCGMNISREFTHFTIALSTTVQSKQNLHMRYVCV